MQQTGLLFNKHDHVGKSQCPRDWNPPSAVITWRNVSVHILIQMHRFLLGHSGHNDRRVPGSLPLLCFNLVWPSGIFPEVLWFGQVQFCKPHLCFRVLLMRNFLLPVLPHSLYSSSLFLIVLSWTLTFNMLSEPCRVWDVALSFFYLEHYMVWPWVASPGMSTPGKIGSWLEWFSLV